jgi:hypothetical protein
MESQDLENGVEVTPDMEDVFEEFQAYMRFQLNRNADTAKELLAIGVDKISYVFRRQEPLKIEPPPILDINVPTAVEPSSVIPPVLSSHEYENPMEYPD